MTNHNMTQIVEDFPYPDDKTYAPWLKFYDPGVPHHIDYEEIPLYSYVDRAAEEAPDKLAWEFENNRMTNAQLRKATEIFAANLKNNGVKPGDRVAIMMPNIPQTIISFWSCLKAGAVVVMTNPLYMEKELVHLIEDSGAECLITVDLCWPKIAGLLEQIKLRKIFVTTIAESLRFPLSSLLKLKNLKDKSCPRIPYDNKTIVPYKTLLKGNERISVPVPDPKNTLALLQYSGGTTGIPKGVMLSHYNLTSNVMQAQKVLYKIFLQDCRFLGVLPFFHVYGLLTCLILPPATKSTLYPMARYVPGDVLKITEKKKITVFPGAPSVYISVLQQKDIAKYDISSLKYCISGSAPLPVEYINMFREKTGGYVIEGYGLTEASPITHLNPEAGKRKDGSIGLPFPDTEARIVDMELGTVPLPTGKIGELVIRGPQVMMGYWNRPDETANTLRNGWLYTGDIAVMDEEGYFSIVDRKKDMIIVGGYNVYPRDIDEVLYAHPSIIEAVAVGIPHPTRGEVIKAYIVLKPGETLSKSDVISYCRSKLANYKVPRQVEFREELPKSMVGKVLRRALQMEEAEKLKKDHQMEETDESEYVDNMGGPSTQEEPAQE